MVVAESSTPAGPAQAAIEAQQNAASLEQDVNRLSTEIVQVRQIAASRFMERDQLSTILSAAEHELAKRRGALDEKTRHKYDFDRDKALAQADLDRLEHELSAIGGRHENTVKIENFPTPISKVVDEKKPIFSFAGDESPTCHSTSSPAKFHSIYESKAHKLRDADEITETYGPLGDFTVRYTLARVEVPWDEAVRTGSGGAYVQL